MSFFSAFPRALTAVLFWIALQPVAQAGSGCLERVRKSLLTQGSLPTAVLYFGRRGFPSEFGISGSDGERLGIKRVILGERLGSGGVGMVYQVKVEDLSGNVREMALKVVRPEYGSNILEREGMILQYLATRTQARGTPSHLVPVRARITAKYESTEVDGYLIDLAGRSLTTMVDSNGDLSIFGAKGIKARPESAIHGLAKLARDLSEALGELSDVDVTHNDIKPANIVIAGGQANDLAEVLAGKARFALIDFGLSVPFGTDHPDAAWFGTEGYVAPEKRQTLRPVHGPATDVYSVACVLAEGLGYAPRFGNFSQSSVEKYLKGTRRKLQEQGVSARDLELFDRVVDFTVRGLASSPEERMRLLREQSVPVLRISPDGSHIGGADPGFSRRVDESH